MKDIFFQNLYSDLLLLALTVTLFILLLLRYQRENLLPLQGRILFCLRALAFFMVVVALQNPLVLSSDILPKQKEVLLVLDDSLSMETKLDVTSRWDSVSQAASQISSSDLSQKFRLPLFLLSDSQRPLVSDAGIQLNQRLESVDPSTPKTQLKYFLNQQLKNRDRRQMAAIILMTDGRSTPSETWSGFETWGVPVHTVLPQESRELRDFRISSLLVPQVCRKQDIIQVAAKVEHTVAKGKVTIGLFLDEILIEERPFEGVTFSSGEVIFNLELNDSGIHKIEVKILEKDDILSNNQFSQLIEVVEDPLKILLVTNQPNYDFRYLREAMTRDQSIELSIYLQSADANHPGWSHQTLKSFPQELTDLLNYDIVIFIDPDLSDISESASRSLIRWVEEAQGAFLYQASQFNHYLDLNDHVLKQILPLVPQEPFVDNNGFSIDLTTDNDDFLSSILPKKIPNFFWAAGVKKIRPLSKVLWATPDGLPLMVWSRKGKGKVGWIGLSHLWRLRIQGGDKYHYGLYNSFARFLSQDRYAGQHKQVRIRFGNEGRVLSGQPNSLEILLFDRFYNPIETRSLDLKIKDPLGEWMPWRVPFLGQGRYVTQINFPRVGPYELNFEVDGQLFSYRFMVHLPQEEYFDLNLDFQTMKSLAQQTGGESITTSSNDVSNLIKKLQELPDEELRQKSQILWNHPYYGFFLLFILALEWFLRRNWSLS